MRVAQVILACGVCGALYSASAWLKTMPKTEAGDSAAKTGELKAFAGMAKFLEVAPQGHLQAMKIDAGAQKDANPAWGAMLPYTRRVPDGVWIAQIISEGGPLGTIEEARLRLAENPGRAVEQIQQVLGELPDRYADERGRLLKFTATLAHRMEDPAQVEALLLREAQRSQEYAISDSALVPQAVALQEYYHLVRNAAKQRAAYKSALEAQHDPLTRGVIQRLAVAADHPSQASDETERDPASSEPTASASAPTSAE